MAKTTPLMAGAPGQQTMSLEDAFDHHGEGILLKQTMKGCLQNCLGCQANTEYNMAGLDWKFLTSSTIVSEGAMELPDELYILEDTNFCLRCCWRDGRPLAMNVSAGAEAGGAPVATYKKPCGFPLQFTCMIPTGSDSDSDSIPVPVPCCCFLPSLALLNPATGEEVTKSQYLCDEKYCVPKFMYSEGGQDIYYVAPDTCCGGFCVLPKGGWGRNFKVPFYFRDPATKEKIVNSNGSAPQIAKVWAGLKKECCSTADTFATFFPDGCDAKRKAGLLGLTLLLDFTVFERQGAANTTV